MHRLAWAAAVASLIGVAPAAADDLEVGGWFGPRIFSSDSHLGYVSSAPAHPSLNSTMELGVRASRPLFYKWLIPEAELAFSPASTTRTGGAESASVLWLDPRVHLRFTIRPREQIFPFAVVGLGAPISLSSARRTFASSVIPEAYAGGGVRFDTRKGFLLRFDARIALIPGIDNAVTAELDVGFGIDIPLGTQTRRTGIAEPPPDTDKDGILDEKDLCVTRAEDRDGFEDTDGCPDIDNDLDRVLDIADRCPLESETYNGISDDDGCPDIVPADIDSIRGTIEGLTYGEGETAVRNAARRQIKRIAKVLVANPTLKVMVIGHTDDREAKQFARAAKGEPVQDIDALSIDLARARAEAVRLSLMSAGAPGDQIIVEGRGASEPVSDNDRKRGRLANRRVEVQLYIPVR
ncbi:MAG: OmpA family protein [Kofleriaceae bacterium]